MTEAELEAAFPVSAKNVDPTTMVMFRTLARALDGAWRYTPAVRELAVSRLRAVLAAVQGVKDEDVLAV